MRALWINFSSNAITGYESYGKLLPVELELGIITDIPFIAIYHTTFNCGNSYFVVTRDRRDLIITVTWFIFINDIESGRHIFDAHSVSIVKMGQECDGIEVVEA